MIIARQHKQKLSIIMIMVIFSATACGASPKHSVIPEQSPADQNVRNRTPNRLIKESSPYLLQHAYNPVDWYPWGPEAFDKAGKEGKPILLSIGYSACHWCHVMAHESFENPATAALMNEHFVCIKVDREQRPDLDDVYMNALVTMTGEGGWPLTIFLTPNSKPFWGGTYFPPHDQFGKPSFNRILSAVAEQWHKDRQGIEQSSDALAAALTSTDKVAQRSTLDSSTISLAINRLLAFSDREWGGLGDAPKFPPSCSLDFLMRASISPSVGKKTRLECHNFTTLTLDKMAQGGIHDQIGGGFARYSTDQQWHVPHFEKMLYNNALLSKNYLDGYLLTAEPYWADVAKHTLDFVLRELSSPEGGFYASLDADSEGAEGRFYLYTSREISSILGESDGQWLSKVLSISASDGSVPRLAGSPEALASRGGISLEEFGKRFARLTNKVLRARRDRVPPKVDTKIIAGWNGLMISSLVAGYKVLDDQRYLVAARRAANRILSKMVRDRRLIRIGTLDEKNQEAFLDDYAFTVQALLDLASVDPDTIWLSKAQELSETMVSLFYDHHTGQFNYKSNNAPPLVAMPKNDTDEPIPAGHSIAIINLLRLGRLTDRPDYLEMAQRSLQVYAGFAAKHPAQSSYLLSAVDLYLAPSSEIVLVVDSSKPDWRPLQKVINHSYLPRSVILYKDINGLSASTLKIPLTQSRHMLHDKPTVYICRNSTCGPPITAMEELSSSIKRLANEGQSH